MSLKFVGIMGKVTIMFLILSVFAIIFVDECNVSAAPLVSASDGKVTSEAANAVNLKEGDWVYSVSTDSSGNVYAIVTGYNGKTTNVKVPSVLGKYAVRSINREAFGGNKYVVSVTLPEGITDIGKYAFRDCIGLREVTLPSTLKSISEGAFYGCKSLRKIEIPDSVTKISRYSFYNCIHLEKANLPSSLKIIGDCAFSGCAMLKAIEFGDNLESVGSMALRGCKALESISLPSSVVSLGVGAFINCTSLKKASIGEGLSIIPNEAFRGCESLEEISVGEKVNTVGNSAFEDCISLKSVNLKGYVKNIGMLAFYDCTSLKKVSLGKSANSIGIGAFEGCKNLMSISVDKNNKTFSSKGGKLYSYDGKTLLICPQGIKGSTSIAEGTEKISDYAFSGCSGISGLDIPESVTQIGGGALLGCTNITVLLVPNNTERIGCMAFGYYFRNGSLKKSSYLNVFGTSGSSSEVYCVPKALRFTPYSKTMLLNTSKAVIHEGDTFDLKAKFLTSVKEKITWKSSDTSVVKVDKGGKLKAVSQGSALVTANANGFDERNIEVTVLASDDNTFNKSKNETLHEQRQMYMGESLELASILDMIIDPILDSNKFWYTTNPAVAYVNEDGRVISTGVGTARITCRASDGREDCCTIRVVEKPAEFDIEQPEKELYVDESFKIRISVVPGNSTEKITWKSDNPNVAEVDSGGNVTGKGQGSCNITAVTDSGMESSVKVTCVVPAEAISINLKNRSVYQGKEFTLETELKPSNSEQSVVWTSSDPSVATVNSKGRVKGVSFGTAIIYARTAEGISDYCTVNVVAKAELLQIDQKKLTMNAGTDHKLNAVILPSYSPETTEKCAWSSTDDNVASVSDNGVVSAVGVGTCIINCKIGGDLISKCQVIVKMPADSVEIVGAKNDIYIGEVLVLKAKLTPENTTDTVEWSSDNTDVAYVTSKGSVKAKSCGSATITVKVTNSVSGKSVTAKYEINVLKKADNIKLNASSISINKGKTDSLMYNLTPSESNDTVRWYSSNDDVAVVRDDGLITAVNKGSCYIYAETGSGHTARCKITVN